MENKLDQPTLENLSISMQRVIIIKWQTPHNVS